MVAWQCSGSAAPGEPDTASPERDARGGVHLGKGECAHSAHGPAVPATGTAGSLVVLASPLRTQMTRIYSRGMRYGRTGDGYERQGGLPCRGDSGRLWRPCALQRFPSGSSLMKDARGR